MKSGRRVSPMPHQRLEDGVEEDEDDADEGHAHEAKRAGIDIGSDTQELEQVRRHDIAERAEHDGRDGDHRHRLGGDVVDHVLTAGAHILRDERGTGHGEPGTERDDEKGHRKADRHGGHGGSAEPPDPEGVGELIAGLERIAENDRDGG
jgi:hypothetical protein